jgi:hypothetical protein
VCTGSKLNMDQFFSVQNYDSLQDGKATNITINLTGETITYLRQSVKLDY